MAANIPKHLRAPLQLRAWELMTHGKIQAEIAAELSKLYPDVRVSQSSVSRWITAQSRRCVERRDDLAAEGFLRALAQFDLHISELWLAWVCSRQPKKSASSTGTGGDAKTRTRVEYREGNPAFLIERRNTIEAKNKLLMLAERYKPAPAPDHSALTLLDVLTDTEADEAETYPLDLPTDPPAPETPPDATATDPS